jgi:type I restriction enzyme S subunit
LPTIPTVFLTAPTLEDRFKPKDKAIEGLKRVNKIDFSGNIYLSNKDSNTDMILVKQGDLLISGINVEKGAVAVYDGQEDVTATIHNSSYEFDDEKIDVEFLKLFLKSPEFLNAIKEQVPGGIKTEIKPKHLLPLEIVIPELDEQKEVVEKFSSFHSKQNSIETELNHQLALAKELRQAYLREAMQGRLARQDERDEPAEILLEKIKAEKEKLVAEKRIRRDKPLPPINAEEIPFEIPSNWTWCRLGEIAEMCLGKMLDQVKNKGELQPYLRNVNVRWGSFDLSDLKEMRFTEDEEERFSAIYGDLIICEGGEPGRAAIWKGEQPIKIQKAVHRVRTNKQALQSEYLYYCLLTDATSKRLNEYFTGGGIQHFTGKSLSKYAIPLPPLAEQERIVAKLEKLMKFCDELEANIRQGIANADQLLQTALKEALQD